MENGSVNTLKFVVCLKLYFQVIPLQSINFDDYVMLHNSRMLFTYVVTFYHIQ